MSVDKNHSEQFEKYLKGEMSSEEANAFERMVLNDPFAQEAMDGLESADPNVLFDDIDKLKQQVKSPSKKGFNWMQIAAVVALLIVGSLTLWFSLDQVQIEDGKELAMEKEVLQESDKIIKLDSIPKEEKEELIADATPVKPMVSKAKEVELKVVDTNEQTDEKVNIEAEVEIEPITTLQVAEADIPDVEMKDEANTSVETPLHGKVAGVKMERSKVVGASSVDTSELEDDAILAQQSIAQDMVEGSDKMIESDSQASKQKSSARSAQPRSVSSFSETISGKVTGDSGESLPGVNVVIKGTTIGTTSDLDGNYSLPKIDNMTLVFSFVGFESQEVQVGGRSTVDVSISGVTELQEVVVTSVGINETAARIHFSATPAEGNSKFNKYLIENLRYPENAENNGIEGNVILELTISPLGKISNIDIKKSLGYGCDDEALRLMNEGPKWNSAKNDGVAVEGKVRVKVKFKLKN
jgi:TonB family protein